MWHALLHFAGVDDMTGRWYAFWSGFGSDLSEFALVGGIAAWARHHNCHTRGCWRLGHPHEGRVHCRRHFPQKGNAA